MTRLLLTLVCTIFLTGCGVEGIHNANPSTRISADAWGGFSVYNSKDVTVSIDEAIYDPSTKSLTVKNLKVEDNASKVRETNALQIDAIKREAAAIGAAWADGFRAAGDMFRSASPVAQLFPAGASGTVSPSTGTASAPSTP